MFFCPDEVGDKQYGWVQMEILNHIGNKRLENIAVVKLCASKMYQLYLDNQTISEHEINQYIPDMANRQGLDENIYYQLFVEIILIGIKEFERYRQNIVRKINAKNQVEGQKATPISDRVLNRPTSVSGLTKEEAKQLATEHR